MQKSVEKPQGWDIDVYRRQFYVSRVRLNVVSSVLSIPYCYHLYHSVKEIWREKKETNSVSKEKFVKIALVDVAILFSGMVTYAVLLRGKLKITPRFSNKSNTKS